MHIKFLKSGQSGRRAVNDLLKEHEQEEVRVRYGEPEIFAALVDSLEYKHKYSSAVIAFAPDDNPNEEQIEEVIEKFKQTAWPGLDEVDFSFVVVERRKKSGKGVYLRFLIAMYHLDRGVQFNPAPPGWQKRYDLLRDYLNLKYGWARPEDPKRARRIQPGYLAFSGVEARKKQVLEWAEALFGAGLSREEVIETAKKNGVEILREGKDHVTLSWGKGQRVRVRVKDQEPAVAISGAEAERKWREKIQFLAEQNKKRYGVKNEQKEVSLPAPVNIACEKCRYAVWQVVRRVSKVESTYPVDQVFCMVLEGWTWDGDWTQGYPVKCSIREELK